MTDVRTQAGPATAEPCLADDLLCGTKAIAAYLLGDPGKSRVAQHLHETRQIPTFKLAGKICARRSTLIEHFTTLEKASTNV
jgi:hypothetical protein